MKEFIFIWNVENMSYAWHKTGEEIVSPKFIASPLQDTCWTLRLYPRGRDNSDYFSLFLHREEDDESEDLKIDFELSCISADNRVLYTWLAPNKYVYFSKGSEFGESQFIKRLEVFGQKKDLQLPRDILTLRCRMWMDDDGDINEFKQMYGRTQLPIEHIVSVETINLEPLAKKTFQIHSKLQNEVLFTVKIEYLSNGIDVTIDPISEVMFSTCKLTLVNKESKRKLWEEMSCSFNGPLANVWRLPFSTKDQQTENGNSNTMDLEFITEFIYSTGEENGTIETMIKDEMTIKGNKCIKIEDISADILEKFLICLYKDALENIEWDSVIELYYAADKYQVERLKHLCCYYLAENVDCDKVCDVLILADRYNDCALKQQVEDFIWKNEEEMVRPGQWNMYSFEQRELAMKKILSKNEDQENRKTPSKASDDIISSHPDVLDDFKRLYQDHIMSDITIKTKSASFPAHKVILFASSSTFKNMLTRTTTDILEIENLEDDIVSRMLLSLYTDSLEDAQWNIVMKLYHAADVFELLRLKLECSRFLLENLNLTNASDLLLLAHEHHDDKLKSAVEDYILLVDEELFGSDEWAEFSKSNLLLANETMSAKYKKNKNL
ncbi:Kelch-like protein 23 like protein [Argiope bruennichi]|uniref:Kelch-like protein 23 like protein n=1 Tax=Argiope bruennichi TaxID=94029 RepID=A0A8T0EQH1_ARGBR|nr:Kelch-like protein 23 like protein [Argiope bruennichi]